VKIGASTWDIRLAKSIRPIFPSHLQIPICYRALATFLLLMGRTAMGAEPISGTLLFDKARVCAIGAFFLTVTQRWSVDNRR